MSDSAPIQLRIGTHVRWSTALTIVLSSETAVKALLEQLKELQETEREVRWRLPENWTLFWKLRPGTESRLLLAHPDATEWVATSALCKEHLAALITKLSAWLRPEISESSEGLKFVLEELGSLSSVSNISIELLFKYV